MFGNIQWSDFTPENVRYAFRKLRQPDVVLFQRNGESDMYDSESFARWRGNWADGLEIVAVWRVYQKPVSSPSKNNNGKD